MNQAIKEQINSIQAELKERAVEGGWLVEALKTELIRLQKKDERNKERVKRNDS
jgi:hypothetical protein